MYSVVVNATETNGDWVREYQIPSFTVEASSTSEAICKAKKIVGEQYRPNGEFFYSAEAI